MTAENHRREVDAVRASLELADSTADRHGTYTGRTAMPRDRRRTPIPFGHNAQAPLYAELDERSRFIVTIFDTEGSPLLTLALSREGYVVIRGDGVRDDTPPRTSSTGELARHLYDGEAQQHLGGEHDG